ncbi:MAG: protein-methionine-sulfoxide reductase catalytic subunit MsrP [Oleiphilaceae bacterium]|nr:protein-methionine-sulfoxide reductase catalytic subunit MsrP [Oleiphilaceae bacterium]
MLIKVPPASQPKPSEITSESAYFNRRQVIGASLAAAASLVLPSCSQATLSGGSDLAYRKASFGKGETLTPYEDVTRYNNFYEFGTDKSDPARYAHEMTVDPWSISIEGEAAKIGTYQLEDILKGVQLEERIYRFRCVEAWSMVVPWVGFSLASLLKRFEPTSKAKYVQFETLFRPEEMRGQRSAFSTIDWPYVEGLRIDEAMHPLSFLAVGLYGKEIPNQNGAPIRLVVPWKYGFKSIKSIVKIRFTEQRPKTSWELAGPSEYGFYSNVNPEVDHPRWSQKTERRLPSSLWSPNRIDTQKFNGYEQEVAGLYAGMDLAKYF